jgi:hypothetical protein
VCWILRVKHISSYMKLESNIISFLLNCGMKHRHTAFISDIIRYSENYNDIQGHISASVVEIHFSTITFINLFEEKLNMKTDRVRKITRNELLMKLGPR